MPRNQFSYGYERNYVSVAGDFTVTGDGTADNYDAQGVDSVTQSGTGTYVIALSRPYTKLLDFSAIVVTVSGSEVLQPSLIEDNVADKSITVRFHDTTSSGSTNPYRSTVKFKAGLRK